LENLEKAKNLLEGFKAETKQPAIRLTTQRSDHIAATSSKFGGLPYLPKNFAYPTCALGNRLKLLAQLNFAELPPLADFPTSGILQFFVLHDENIGREWGNPINDGKYKVIYHKEIHENDRMTDFPEIKFVPPKFVDKSWLPKISAESFPFEGEFLVTGELVEVPPISYTWDFNVKFKAFCEKYGIFSEFEPYFLITENFGDWLKMTETMPQEEQLATKQKSDKIEDLLIAFFGYCEWHLIGSYPFFTQEDPRFYVKNSKKYDTLLFQMASEYEQGKPKDCIMWGDMGVANFFINRQNLQNLKFDDVLYNWDCS